MLWEILIPVMDNQGTKFDKKHHQRWDKEVLSLVKGLTILQANDGIWQADSGQCFKESMLVVRIAATKEQMEIIIEFTAKHYEQKAVMAYKISDDVIIRQFAS